MGTWVLINARWYYPLRICGEPAEKNWGRLGRLVIAHPLG